MTDETIQKEELKSIGGTLLLARTEAGFSQEEIAKKLHLSKTFVQYLEDDEFDRLGQSAVFIRGYVRGYARLVNISETEIVHLLDASNVKDAPSPKKIFIPTQKQISVRDKKMRWLTYGIIILFLVLIFIWWRSQVSVHHRNKASTTVVVQSQPSTAEVENTDVVANQTVTQPDPVTKLKLRKKNQQKSADTNDVTNQLHVDYNG